MYIYLWLIKYSFKNIKKYIAFLIFSVILKYTFQNFHPQNAIHQENFHTCKGFTNPTYNVFGSEYIVGDLNTIQINLHEFKEYLREMEDVQKDT